MTNRNISFIVKDQQPLMLRPTDSVQMACRRMCERNVGAVLVTDSHHHLKGIFTGRDAVQMIGAGGHPAETSLSAGVRHFPPIFAPFRKVPPAQARV